MTRCAMQKKLENIMEGIVQIQARLQAVSEQQDQVRGGYVSKREDT